MVRRIPLIALWFAACAVMPTGACREGSSAATGAAVEPSAIASTASAPPAAPSGGSLQLALPVARGDSAAHAMGIWPFGVHGADHALDGHPGWDVEFRPGAFVRAAAAGTVQSVVADGSGLGSVAIQVEHRLPTGHYRTDYIHVTSIPAGIAPGAAVAVGQEIGAALVQTRMIGSRAITYAAIHFQVDDFSSVSGLTNVNAVSPERWLSEDARAQFAELWRSAIYNQELTEPFPDNPRDVAFPLRRTWTRESGSLAAQIVFSRPDAQAVGYDYECRDGAGGVLERGVAVVDPTAVPLATIDFTNAATGTVRRGVWAVESDQLRLDVAAPGASRPSSLTASAVYRTVR